ncbi:MAG: hypothetical protein KJN77_03355 [Gammaproteobacteria bacterium]|nr:hypothetical protein [Gammaproteobacteria bacterium]
MARQFLTLRRLLSVTISAFLLLPAAALGDCALDCSWCSTKGEMLKCKFDLMTEEGQKTIDELQQPPYKDLLPPAQVEGLKKARDNMGRGKDRLKPDDFHLMAKKKATACQWVESSASNAQHNGDGICELKREDCAEVPDDGIGNDDGICHPLNGKKREVCVQICDEEAVLLDEANVDDDTVAELDGIFDNLAKHSKEVNEGLAQAGPNLLAVPLVGDANNPCDIDAQGLSRTNDTLKALARGAATGARGGAEISERFCDQLVAANCGACCAPGEAVAGALEAAATAIDIIEETINSATIDAALACVKAIKTTAGNSNAMLLQIQSSLDAAQTEQAEIVRLLTTPLGQRGTSK